jgi:hypothetical protein
MTAKGNEMTNASMEINVSYTNWRGVTSVRRVWLGDVRFGTTEWHEEPTWLIKAFDLDHPAQIWKEFDLCQCDFNREEIGKKERIAELEAALSTARADALREAANIANGYGSCACDPDMHDAILRLIAQPTQ